MPFPLPSIVFWSAIVGFPVVFQQMPLAVIGSLPSKDIFPPLATDVDVIVPAAVVVISGRSLLMQRIAKPIFLDEIKFSKKL